MASSHGRAVHASVVTATLRLCSVQLNCDIPYSWEPMVYPEGGVGLGLSLVRTIAQRHGGQVRCEAAPGGGACFVLSLPLHRQPMRA